MLIIDREWRKQEKRPRYGKIASKGVDKEGNVTLGLPNGAIQKFSIGLKDAPVQVKLLGKDDGTFLAPRMYADGSGPQGELIKSSVVSRPPP